MAKILLMIYPCVGDADWTWNFRRIFDMDTIPREGDDIHCGNDCYQKVDHVAHNFEENRLEIDVHCELSDAAGWLVRFPDWEIDYEEGFRKDEAELRHYIRKYYEEDTFIPVFKKRENED